MASWRTFRSEMEDFPFLKVNQTLGKGQMNRQNSLIRQSPGSWVQRGNSEAARLRAERSAACCRSRATNGLRRLAAVMRGCTALIALCAACSKQMSSDHLPPEFVCATCTGTQEELFYSVFYSSY